ncbi:heme-binding protein [Streptococcus suis]|uniref:Heme-binding protein n=1 Tax=Streptococcus suis TaxID=1307 RepID=A0A9X4MRW3_STRSU|nr:heme-binding protein [Streptococcus suis]MBY5024801.1 heme-binding protein [Streptococcus suis]MCK3935809.1 heme-binding protein [Streptococcus suis]MDG4526292.1 heme-binding protein [Streptococcus suis]MDG4528855.1 heme-binding protein [Streptococcus suis]NQM40493.1 heme-binding protein [Streptococcus suis]
MTQNQNQIDEILLQRIIQKCQELLEKKDDLQTINLYDLAFDIVNRAREKAQELKVPVVITLVDAAAHVILSYRMEDSLLVSYDMAYRKAYTAVGMKMQSKDLAVLTKPDQWLFQLEAMSEGQIVSLAGGIPIYSKGRIIGAIGISGGNAIEDQTIAEYAIEKIHPN